MPRKYYKTTPVEMESLPNWVKSSKTGEARKIASDDGETERLKKRGREMQARRNMKETERMRRYEESMKRKEKMVKQDKRKSKIVESGTGEAGNHSYQIGSKLQHDKFDKQVRWQLGDGLRVEPQIERLKNAKRGANCAEPKKQDKRKSESRTHNSCKQVKIVVKKSSGKERAREWVEAVQKEYNSDERVLIGRSWAWFSVPQGSEISDQESGDETEVSALEREDLSEYPVSWPISRFCLEDPLYIPIIKTLTAPSESDSSERDVAPALEMESDISDTSCTLIKRQAGNKKSFKCRIAAILRSISRRVWGKAV